MALCLIDKQNGMKIQSSEPFPYFCGDNEHTFTVPQSEPYVDVLV